MSSERLIQNIIETPQTKGEYRQSETLKSFHNDAGVIVDIREKLDGMKQDLIEEQKKTEHYVNELKKRKNIDGHGHRPFDKLIFREKPKNNLTHFLSYFKTKKLFSYKYRNDSKISWQIINLIFNDPIFFTSSSVYYFVKQLISTQQLLRTYVRKMYRSGWLDDDGEEGLTPYEYNLIGELERVIHDDSLITFNIFRKDSARAILKINSFLGYYFSITRDNKTRKSVIDAATKSLKNIVCKDTESKKIIPGIIKKIEEFLSPNVDAEFFVPLFESAYLRIMSEEEIRKMTNIREIEKDKYLANNNMHIYMANKRNELNNNKEKKIIKIEKEIDFIQRLLEIINKKVIGDNYKEMPFLDYILLAQNNLNRDDYSLRKNNIAAYLSDISNYFFNVFGNFFTEGVNIKINSNISTVKIFDKELFKLEINELEKQKRFLSDYISSGFDFTFLNKQTNDKNTLMFIDIINIICDNFYSIGNKLLWIKNSHISKKTSNVNYTTISIDDKNIENAAIPYHTEKIFVISSTGNKKTSLSNKTIFEAIGEIMDFCFNVVYKFEYTQRKFNNSARDESLNDKIKRLDQLMFELDELENFRNIE